MLGLLCSSLCLLIAGSLLVSTAIGEDSNYRIKFISLPLDHFNYVNNSTFQLRYLINDTYATNDPLAPILFYTGNEGDIELFAKNTGFIWELAQTVGAMIVFAEHRYYGQSLPFGNKSYDDPEHFGYLTAEQALADYAELLHQLTDSKNDRAVIAIGGSYGGMLAAWFRMKYPHLVTGALAASAPILQFTSITPCEVFSRIVTSVFSSAYNSNCSSNIKKSWDVFRNYSSTKEGRDTLNKKFKLCSNSALNKSEDINDFFDYLEDVYANLAMANYPYENQFLAPLPAYPVRIFCGQLSNIFDGTNLLDAMKKAINIYANYSGKIDCLNFGSAFQSDMGTKGWEFQSCTEMVMPMCSGGQSDMFREKKWDLKKYSDDCFKKFGVRPREHEIINRYGGKRINSASNIIFSNGLLDPWSGGGVLGTPNNKINIIIIPEGAHHIDLRAANAHDPVSVREARKQEVKIIKSWIYNFNMFS